MITIVLAIGRSMDIVFNTTNLNFYPDIFPSQIFKNDGKNSKKFDF